MMCAEMSATISVLWRRVGPPAKHVWRARTIEATEHADHATQTHNAKKVHLGWFSILEVPAARALAVKPQCVRTHYRNLCDTKCAARFAVILMNSIVACTCAVGTRICYQCRGRFYGPQFHRSW